MENEVAGWFSNLDRVADIAMGAIYFYAILVLVTRLAGKRSTSQLNNFDWIINVAVGSLAASGILIPSISRFDATVAIAALAAAQWLVTWVVARNAWALRIVRSHPRLLTDKGEYLEGAMLKERITREEIRAKLREAGLFDPVDANWVILESDGTFSVMPQDDRSVTEVPLMDGVASLQASPRA